MQKIAVLIPCYNEAQSIFNVVTEFKQALPNATIYVYDNNSTDATAQLAAEAGAIVYHEYRQGKGNVIRSMFRKIEADCYLMIDGDGSMSVEHANEMIDLVLTGKADMVTGDRLSSNYYNENKRPFHNFGNRIVKNTINNLFSSNVNDIMTGYRAFSRPFVKTFPVLSKGFEIETEMTIHALDKNFLICEVPVNFKERQGDVSQLNTYVDGYRVFRMIFGLYKDYKPLAFFGRIAALLLLIFFILFIPIFLEFLNTHLVPRFPTLIVSGVVFMCALQCYSIGLILEVVAKKHRQQFELELNRWTNSD